MKERLEEGEATHVQNCCRLFEGEFGKPRQKIFRSRHVRNFEEFGFKVGRSVGRSLFYWGLKSSIPEFESKRTLQNLCLGLDLKTDVYT